MAGRILVIGATGTVGSQLVTQLDQRGEKVRAATREPAAARRRLNGAAELVKFDFERPETFAPALDGADRVFLIARPGDEQADRVAVPLIDEMKRQGVLHVVNLSRSPIRTAAACPTRMQTRVSSSSTTYVEVTRGRRSRPGLAAAASLPGGGPVFVDTGAFADAAGTGKSFIIANSGRARYAAPMARTKPATIDRFGRILIPKALREGAGLRAGTEVEIVAEGRGLRLLPRDEGVLLREVGGVLVASGEAVGDLVGAVRRDRQKRLDKVASRRR